MSRTIKATDLFCGAGGTSLGLSEACVELGYGLELLAVNHWPVAIATHSKNHKLARHMHEWDLLAAQRVCKSKPPRRRKKTLGCTHRSISGVRYGAGTKKNVLWCADCSVPIRITAWLKGK